MKRELNKTQYGIRTSQLISQYGVGGLVDFSTQTLMTAAPEKWSTKIPSENKIFDQYHK